MWIYRLGLAFKTRTVARAKILLRLFENFKDFATFVCLKCGRFLRIGLRFENRQCGGIGRGSFVNAGLWRIGVGTKKARECCLNRRRFRASFQNGVANGTRIPTFYFVPLCYLNLGDNGESLLLKKEISLYIISFIPFE